MKCKTKTCFLPCLFSQKLAEPVFRIWKTFFDSKISKQIAYIKSNIFCNCLKFLPDSYKRITSLSRHEWICIAQGLQIMFLKTFVQYANVVAFAYSWINWGIKRLSGWLKVVEQSYSNTRSRPPGSWFSESCCACCIDSPFTTTPTC